MYAIDATAYLVRVGIRVRVRVRVRVGVRVRVRVRVAVRVRVRVKVDAAGRDDGRQEVPLPSPLEDQLPLAAHLQP